MGEQTTVPGVEDSRGSDATRRPGVGRMTRAVRHGRWGIQQKTGDVWTSCTVWMGFERRDDAEAHVAYCNGQSPVEHRVYDRHVRQGVRA